MVSSLTTARTGRLRAAVGHASQTGPRDDNQDFCSACLEDPRSHHGLVAALADGVGGRKGGRVAAELSVRSFIDDYLSQPETRPPLKTAGNAVEAINRWIYQQGTKDENLKGMSCAFTGIVVRGHRLHSFHVGDTRLYRLRAGQLSQLTTDHKPEGAEQSNYITRAIGFEEAVRIDYRMNDVAPHDRLMLCSDGVHGFLSPSDITRHLSGHGSPDEAAEHLVAAALEAGGNDNATALVVDVLELPPATIEDLDAAISRLPMMSPPRVGSEVDGFKLEAQISDGDYSRVFRARDLKGQYDGPILLKFPKPHAVGGDSPARSAFLRETWVASRVQHVWIGSVLLLPPGRQTALYVAQPFYEGQTLEDCIERDGPFTLEAGIDIAIKLAKALGSLHRAGVIHRDIKPDNILLLKDGGLKLVDLGFARLPNIDQKGALPLGTRNFMAPELFEDSEGDERSDIFALGVTLHRLFSGKYPYGEGGFDKPDFARLQRLSEIRRDLPAWLESVVLQAIAPDPDERFQDGWEMAFKLETGAHGAAPASLKKGYLARHPEKLWQGISLVLMIALLVSLFS